MSIASYAVSDASVAAQAGSPADTKKPPPKRVVVARADSTELPEPR